MIKTSPGPLTASCPTEVKMGAATLPTSSVLRTVCDGARTCASTTAGNKARAAMTPASAPIARIEGRLTWRQILSNVEWLQPTMTAVLEAVNHVAAGASVTVAVGIARMATFEANLIAIALGGVPRLVFLQIGGAIGRTGRRAVAGVRLPSQEFALT
jgi:hypothetical protein